ncbi:MAG: hypothetical protein KY459_11920 [Acidobacteria bacterium]|nr:hypothetical protein [Acidobacteriota bacterium]
MKLTVVCADVGSVKAGNFGWAIRDIESDSVREVEHGSIGAMAGAVAEALDRERKVALGFECPLFIPLRDDPMMLNRARNGEGNRAWCAGAGSGALATGIVQVSWALRAIRQRIGPRVDAFLSWTEFRESETGLFLWEAFVSRDAKADTHEGDAAIAVDAFIRALPHPDAANAIREVDVVSLVGAAMLRTGWSKDPELLARSCLVIRA